MQIKKALQFDRSINRYIGSISREVGGPDDEPMLSDHALVFILRGMTKWWRTCSLAAQKMVDCCGDW